MEEHASNRWTDYSLVCIIRRIVKEIPTVIAAGLIAAMLTVAYLQVFYKPQYTVSTTVAVGMKNASYTSVFSNLSSTSEMAGTFTKLFDSTMFSTISKEKLGVEKLNGAEGDTVTFKALMISDGDAIKTGAETENVKVTGTIVKQGKAGKIIVFKYKAKKNERKKQGHRQPYTAVKIEKIEL